MADAAATAGAQINAIDQDRRRAIEQIDADTLALLKRLICINLLHAKVEADPERGTQPNSLPSLRPTFGQLVRDSRHRTYYRGKRYYCIECSSSCSKRDIKR